MDKITTLNLFYILLFFSLINNVNAAPLTNTTDEADTNKNQQLAEEHKAKAIFYSKLAKSYDPKLYGEDTAKKVATSHNPWKGTQIGLGAGGTTGNNNSLNAQGTLLINYDPSPKNTGWSFNTIGQYDYLTSHDSGLQKNRLYLQQNGYYMFNKTNGLFGQISFLKDALDGYQYTANENIGYQLQFFQNNIMKLLFSFGPGIQEQKITGQKIILSPSWLSQITYNLNISDTLSFNEQLQNIITHDNIKTTSTSSITIKATENIGIGINYQFSYETTPPEGKSNLINIAGVTLVYSIN